jgi:hypothetical protein
MLVHGADDARAYRGTGEESLKALSTLCDAGIMSVARQRDGTVLR